MDTDGNPALTAQIARVIGAAGGRITFAAFMAMALYDLDHGYYTTVGRPERDYRTSPQVHPVFGTLIARQLEQMWEVMGRPAEFTAVEMGAGDGKLCGQVLGHCAASAPRFFRRLRYLIVEASPAQRERQGAALADFAGKVAWRAQPVGEWAEGSINGCFLSNELVDAFPVHRVTVADGSLQEIYVMSTGDGFGEVAGPPSTPQLPVYFERLGLSLAEGTWTEVNVDALRWMRAVGRALGRGFVITIDYGYPAEELFSRPKGSLVCYYRQKYSDDPYVRVGQQDITSHVDFTSLILEGQQSGLRFTGMLTQSDFLRNLGIEAFNQRKDLSPAAFYDQKFAIRELSDPNGLGRFKVLLQHKGLREPGLDALNSCNERKRKMWAQMAGRG